MPKKYFDLLMLSFFSVPHFTSSTLIDYLFPSLHLFFHVSPTEVEKVSVPRAGFDKLV